MVKKKKHDRKVRKGIDYEKLVKIWRVLESNPVVYVAQIARQTKIPESTVRYYLDKYLDRAVENRNPLPAVKLRLISLKPNIKVENYVKALQMIEKKKSS